MHRLKLALVVFIETFIISVIGVLAGFVLGLFPILYFHYNPIRLTTDMEAVVQEWGIEPVMPAAIAPDIFLWQGMVIFLITMVICLYPGIRIFTLDILKHARS